MMYKIIYTSQARKDYQNLKRSMLLNNALKLLSIIQKEPYKNPPPFEKLSGDLAGAYSRRLNRQHRLVYQVLPNTDREKDENGMFYAGIIKIIRMWTHYE